MKQADSRRVLIVVSKDWYFLSHRVPLARALRGAGFWVSVAAGATGREGEIAALGFPFHPIPFDRGRLNPFLERHTVLALTRLYRQLSPEIVHHVALKPIVYGSIAAIRAGVPHIINMVTGLGYLFTGSGLLRSIVQTVSTPLFRAIGRQERVRYVFFNDEDRRFFCERGFAAATRSTVLPGSGVDTGHFRFVPEPPGVPVITCVGRLLRTKGIVELVDAARLLKERGRAFHLRLAGTPDSSNREAVPEALLDEWRREGIVEMLGFVRDPATLLASSHIVALPSYREGLSLSLIEAAACGRPIVTTDVPGCRDVVTDGVNGFLVPSRDPVRLADALDALLVDAELRTRMGGAGRARACEEWSEEAVARKILALYRGVEGRDDSQ